MNINLFPAIVLAGPPHSGKSVLAFMLTQQLRRLKVAHYLLRAVPDGEGNWFLQGNESIVRSLRMKNKGKYTSKFLSHMESIIESRPLPLLVDIGGKPQPSQMGILDVCTHSILLYRTEAERDEWKTRLENLHLLPIAEIRSSLVEDDLIKSDGPILTGVITGLEREQDQRKQGVMLAALTKRLAGICFYDEEFLQKVQLQHAPYPVLTEQELATSIGLNPDDHGMLRWTTDALNQAAQRVLPGSTLALYGRGPVWLAAMIAARCWPADMIIFDVRYGWVKTPVVKIGKSDIFCTNYTILPDGFGWLECLLTEDALDLGDLRVEHLPTHSGIVLSGRLPRWAFAALTRYFMACSDWVALDDPGLGKIVVVHSSISTISIGDTIDRPLISSSLPD